MLSNKLQKLIIPTVAIALMGAPIALAGCAGKDNQDVPTSEDVDNAARSQKGSASSSNGGGGGGGSTGGKQGDLDATAYDADGNPIISTEAGDIILRTSEDGNYSTSDFVLGSAIYGRKTAAITNDYQFVKDGIGTWEMVALKDVDGYVFAGSEIKPTSLTMTADNYGVLMVNGNESPFGWQQYKDFPQLALGDIGKQMTITMELNDDGMMTVRQDVDGQVMLFKKVSSGEVAEQPAEQQPAEQVSEQQPAEQPAEETPSVEASQIEGEPAVQTFGE